MATASALPPGPDEEPPFVRRGPPDLHMLQLLAKVGSQEYDRVQAALEEERRKALEARREKEMMERGKIIHKEAMEELDPLVLERATQAKADKKLRENIYITDRTAGRSYLEEFKKDLPVIDRGDKLVLLHRIQYDILNSVLPGEGVPFDYKVNPNSIDSRLLGDYRNRISQLAFDQIWEYYQQKMKRHKLGFAAYMKGHKGNSSDFKNSSNGGGGGGDDVWYDDHPDYRDGHKNRVKKGKDVFAAVKAATPKPKRDKVALTGKGRLSRGHLVKGSLAAKRYMAYLRSLRGRY